MEIGYIKLLLLLFLTVLFDREAWANMGAIYVELQEPAKAFVSFVEALKIKRDSWKIIENLIVCATQLHK